MSETKAILAPVESWSQIPYSRVQPWLDEREKMGVKPEDQFSVLIRILFNQLD